MKYLTITVNRSRDLPISRYSQNMKCFSKGLKSKSNSYCRRSPALFWLRLFLNSIRYLETVVYVINTVQFSCFRLLQSNLLNATTEKKSTGHCRELSIRGKVYGWLRGGAKSFSRACRAVPLVQIPGVSFHTRFNWKATSSITKKKKKTFNITEMN